MDNGKMDEAGFLVGKAIARAKEILNEEYGVEPTEELDEEVEAPFSSRMDREFEVALMILDLYYRIRRDA